MSRPPVTRGSGRGGPIEGCSLCSPLIVASRMGEEGPRPEMHPNYPCRHATKIPQKQGKVSARRSESGPLATTLQRCKHQSPACLVCEFHFFLPLLCILRVPKAVTIFGDQGLLCLGYLGLTKAASRFRGSLETREAFENVFVYCGIKGSCV